MLFKKLAGDTFVYGGADLVTKIIAFFTFPIIAAALSPRDFGVLELVMTLVGLAGVFVNCGLNNAVQRFYWDPETAQADRPALVTSGLIIQMSIGFVFSIAIIVALPFVVRLPVMATIPVTAIGLIAAAFILVVTQTTQYIQDVIRLHFKPGQFLVYTLLGRVLVSLCAVVAVVAYQAGVDGILIVQAVVGVCVLPIGFYFIRSDLCFSFDRARAKELFHFGYPFIFAALAYWLFGSMDRWMLAAMSSVEEVGIYSVAYRFATIVLFVSAAFGQAWSPHAMKVRMDQPSGYRTIYADILLFLVYGMLVVGGGIALFSGEIMAVIMPGEYRGSAIPLAILCFGIVLQSTQQITATGISLEKKTHILMNMAWLTAAVNFFGNWILIPRYGAEGAAAATLLSYAVLTGGYMYFSQKLHPIPVAWKRLCALTSLGAVVLIVSVMWSMVEFDLSVVGTKLLIAILCLALGGLVLPIKGTGYATK